jgi:hypothetical protein
MVSCILLLTFLDINWGGVWLLCLPPAFTLVPCLAYSSNLKMVAICSSETLVDFQQTTWRYTLVDNIFQNFPYVGFTIGFTYAYFK